ncbi:MAG: aminotransferase class III-fold pyridoxal phosphate-dependent enzyme [Novosphingobium sp.]
MSSVPFLPDPAQPPYSTREAAEEAYSRHVSAGHVSILNSVLSFHNIHYGKRENGRVQDVYSGRWFFDCHRGGSTFNLGHLHPELVRVAKEALDYVDAGSFSQVSGYRAMLASKLAESTSGALTGSIFGCNGGDAIEIAAHAARYFTGRHRFVAIETGSFHGHNEFGLTVSAISGAERKHYGIAENGTIFVPFNDLPAMRAALAQDDVAGVIIEPTPAQSGFPTADPDYLKGVKAACEANGVLFILDEVQTGMGSCGTMWSYESDGYTPDIIASGKGLGGGMFAISAATMREDVWRKFTGRDFAPHGSTYGGSEHACIVATRAIELTLEPSFLAHTRKLASIFAKGFADAPYPVTQRGLCMGLWTGDSRAAAAALSEAGVLTIPSGVAPVLPFRPILTIAAEEAEDIIAIVRSTLG